jgi:hypothetical protein
MTEKIFNGNITTNAGSNTFIRDDLTGGTGQRSVIVITNLEAVGGNTVYLSWGTEAAANKGVVLAPTQSWIESIDSGFKPSNMQINAYCAAAVSLAIHERVKEV